ncbi:Predicted dithiol-disulfide isomerase, DsbA family [Streptomyces zhaozhouensis]|uniref:Predicted dithiol-disulfide isomerase, DsbA family n=2 Tax=Streptomyces zhaozhouensis TaxID=1300267 RepID=A0A286DJT0_9ACTN|nr:Predicted dithiol-disulfide isomerase, DsbA family [Streptomyces zhaozhouensis]
MTETTEAAAAMRVEIWGDIVCPWCYLGAARFERALADFPHRDRVEVVHRSFELDPRRESGVTEPVSELLARRYGPRAAEMERSVAELAESEGLPYRTERLVGNTLDAHRLLQFAGERGLRHRLVDVLYAANFARGEDLFGVEALVGLAVEAGLDAEEARGVLEDPTAYRDAVHTDQRTAARLGATGVPFFVLDGRLGVAGGQSVDVFAQALDRAWGDRSPLERLGGTDAEDGEVCAPGGDC